MSYLNQAAVNAEVLDRRGYLDSDVEQRRTETERQVKERILQKQQQEEEDWEGQNVELPSDVVNQARAEGILGLASSVRENCPGRRFPHRRFCPTETA